MLVDNKYILIKHKSTSETLLLSYTSNQYTVRDVKLNVLVGGANFIHKSKNTIFILCSGNKIE